MCFQGNDNILHPGIFCVDERPLAAKNIGIQIIGIRYWTPDIFQTDNIPRIEKFGVDKIENL